MLMLLLFVPLLPALDATILILPPGPGAAALSNDSNCALLPILIATPLVFALVIPILPPWALCRTGATVLLGSADETWTRLLTVTVPLLEFRLTSPPAPLGFAPGWMRPLVASMSELTVMSLVVFTVKVPPLPGPNVKEPSPPLKETEPTISGENGMNPETRRGREPKPSVKALTVRAPPFVAREKSPTAATPSKLIPPAELSKRVVNVCRMSGAS